MLCRVSEEFIRDKFNLKGLRHRVPEFYVALQTILDLPAVVFQDCSDDSTRPNAKSYVGDGPTLAYELIHARYIQTPEGMRQIVLIHKNKY